MPALRATLVLFAPGDEAFVRGYLLSALGGDQNGGETLRVLDPATSPGDLDRELAGCRTTLVVVSSAFLADPRARHAELLASERAIDDGAEVIALELEADTLPPHLRVGVHVDFVARERWDSSVDRLRRHLALPAARLEPLACPYPGMRAFSVGEASVFHGRDREVTDLLRRISAGQRSVLVIGPSGCGKSSLVAAGVVPRFPGAARSMSPGDRPYTRLLEALGVGGVAAPEVDHAAIADCMRDAGAAQLLVVVDQLEELFASVLADEGARFASALQRIIEHPQCVVICTLRSDRHAELMASPLWDAGLRCLIELAPLPGAGLRAAIQMPARARGVYFEPGLVERLLADAADAPGAMPLLQDALAALWARRRHHLITLADYEALAPLGRSGLVAAALARADRCLAAMSPADGELACRLLLRLVSLEDERAGTRRSQSRRALGATDGSAADRVLRALAEARVVACGGVHDATDQVDLSHGALVTDWPPLAALVASRGRDELHRRRLQAAATAWQERGRNPRDLLDARHLARALAWRRSGAAIEFGDSAEIRELLAASHRRLADMRWIRRGLTAGAMLVAFFAGLALRSREATPVDD